MASSIDKRAARWQQVDKNNGESILFEDQRATYANSNIANTKKDYT
jgi:hypothetical protein